MTRPWWRWPLSLALRGLRHRCGALALLSEREARDVLGMPPRHPENLTWPLRRADERRITALGGELWPNDEYAREA